MSSPVAKSAKKLSTRASSRRAANASARKRAVPKTTRLKPATKRSPAGKARAHKATKITKAKPKTKTVARKAAKRTPAVRKKAAAVSSRAAVKRTPPKRKPIRTKAPLVLKRPAPPQPPPQLTRDEAAALQAFEAAHKEFSRGHFAEARILFRSLVEKYPTVSEVTARARTYLAVA